MSGEVPTGRPAPLAYAGVVVPPLLVALTYPDLFFPALEARPTPHPPLKRAPLRPRRG